MNGEFVECIINENNPNSKMLTVDHFYEISDAEVMSYEPKRCIGADIILNFQKTTKCKEIDPFDIEDESYTKVFASLKDIEDHR